MAQFEIGDNDADQSDYVPVEINPGDSVTVTNLAGSNATVNYLTSFDGAPTALTAGNSQTFTVGPLWLQSLGVATVKITGGVYGN